MFSLCAVFEYDYFLFVGSATVKKNKTNVNICQVLYALVLAKWAITII